MGALVRLDQFTWQVLIDDEWHAVHRLLEGATAGELFQSFGRADYSIPLALLYSWVSRNVGLSELGMRWPMMLAGLLTLVLFTAWAWKRVSPRAAAFFALLLASSPLLVIYSRVARPYALTVLLAYLALLCFHRFGDAGRGRLAWGAGYAVSAAMCAWLHPITGPFVVAPFLVAGTKVLVRRRWGEVPALIALGLATGALMAAVLLPPLLGDPAALAAKAGSARYDIGTFLGVWYVWAGASSTLVLVGLLALAALGFPRLLRSDELWTSALLGLLSVFAAVLVLQPAWAQHPLTLGRYLLPAVPLLLLAAALGADGLLRWAGGAGRGPGVAAAVLMGVFLAAYLAQSPLRPLLADPNSQGNHALFQLDFRPGHNAIADYQAEHIPLSPFWSTLGDTPPVGIVAAGPFHFESYNWDAPRWERRSGHRVLPLALGGWCAGSRRGEVPDNQRFEFRNAVAPDALDRDAFAVSWVVLTRPFTGYERGREGQAVGAAAFEACRGPLERLFGPPAWEDELLVAFRVSPAP